MSSDRERRLVFDWNRVRPVPRKKDAPVRVHDETLRDGLQSPGVRIPQVGERLELLREIARLGIDSVDIGFPGMRDRVGPEVEVLLRAVAEERLPLRPVVAARTVLEDIRPIVDMAQRTGVAPEAALFIGSSPLRMYAEGWSVVSLERRAEEAVGFAVAEGLEVLFVTEDTTRSRPEHLERVFATALRAGAGAICLADTVGHAVPAGAAALVEWACALVERVRPGARVDWHGHNDRGLALANALAAARAGADQVHATALGVGERVGNTPMEQLLVNLRLLGWWHGNLGLLTRYCGLASRLLGVAAPGSAPVVGRDAFRTGTGVHASALLKARVRGDGWLADRVYSGVPAAMVGRQQVVTIGPMSGASNVRYWLANRGHEAPDELIARILEKARGSRRNLRDAEVETIVREFEP